MAIRIVIESLPHGEQRYDTVGDWYIGFDATWHIRVSKMQNWRHEILVAIHELCEMAMCMHDGVSQTLVDEFDKVYEASRAEGDTSEPGDNSGAPYYKQHGVASGIERIMATLLRVDWNAYDEEVKLL